jgi:hypothetical protein
VTASERFAAEGEMPLGELTDGFQHRVSGPSRGSVGDQQRLAHWDVDQIQGGVLIDIVGSGYRAGAFEVEAAYPPGSPPTVNGTTPRYPGELQHDDIPVPEVLCAH